MARTNLAKARKDAGLTQTEIASAVGISMRMYSYIESGEKNGSLEVWKKISSVLNQPIEYLEEQGGK